MIDFNVFDSILDSAFVIDGDGKIVYCNDTAASFTQTSARRMIGKMKLSDILDVDEAGILPFGEASQGRLAPSPFIETVFRLTKAGSTGKAQVAVRPLDETHWLFFLRDVSLEEALHSKYRSELSQKEEYARNLEKLVALRTEQLEKINKTLDAILNSLGEGFLTFDSEGRCGPIFSRACLEIFGDLKAGTPIWDVLKIPVNGLDEFRKWTSVLFSEALPFEDLKDLGPKLFDHPQQRRIALEYFPIRGAQGTISEIVLVATDKTVEFAAQTALEYERVTAAMMAGYLRNRDQFLQFLASVRRTVQKLKFETDMNEVFRILHTLEGEAGTFSITDLVKAAKESQDVLDVFRGENELSADARVKYRESLSRLEESFENFLNEHREIFRFRGDLPSRMVEMPVDTLLDFMSALDKNRVPKGILQDYEEIFLKVTLNSRLSYFNDLAQSVALNLGKRIKPLLIEGGEIRISPEPYQKFFSNLVHVFRNAVDHGLETEAERTAAGKDPAGQIRIQASKAGGKLVLLITDDGRGIDPVIIRAKLKEKFPDKDFSSENDEQVINNVFLPGFSSRETAGEFSGRGVGMDALREEILSMGGQIDLKSTVGRGTVIKITLPELDFKTLQIKAA